MNLRTMKLGTMIHRPVYQQPCQSISEPLEIPHIDRRMRSLVVYTRVVALVTIRFDS